MPNKKKKYNARFPPARIKKIMQTDEEVGKVAAAVPVIISRALELFVESLIKKSSEITLGRNAKTLTTSHLKQCILSENKFDFLKDLVAAVPDVQGEDESSNPPPAETVKPSYYVKHSGKQRMPRLRKNVDLEDSAGPSRTATEESDEQDSDEEEEEEEECDDEEENNLDATTNSHGPKSTYFKNVGVTNIILSNRSSNGSAPSAVITKPGSFTSLHPTAASLDEDYDS